MLVELFQYTCATNYRGAKQQHCERPHKHIRGANAATRMGNGMSRSMIGFSGLATRPLQSYNHTSKNRYRGTC